MLDGGTRGLIGPASGKDMIMARLTQVPDSNADAETSHIFEAIRAKIGKVHAGGRPGDDCRACHGGEQSGDDDSLETDGKNACDQSRIGQVCGLANVGEECGGDESGRPGAAPAAGRARAAAAATSTAAVPAVAEQPSAGASEGVTATVPSPAPTRSQRGSGGDATVTLCHSRTRDLPAITRSADILVAAIGQPKFVTAEMVKPGAVVVDERDVRDGEAVGVGRADGQQQGRQKGEGKAHDRIIAGTPAQTEYRFIGMKRLTKPDRAGKLPGIHRDRLRDRPEDAGAT